jgi:phage terminase Nu1 subunit (DNA packaging protein)
MVRRSSYGRSTVDVPSMASRSNATKHTGTSRRRISIRWLSRSKARPPVGVGADQLTVEHQAFRERLELGTSSAVAQPRRLRARKPLCVSTMQWYPSIFGS